LIYSTYSVIY